MQENDHSDLFWYKTLTVALMLRVQRNDNELHCSEVFRHNLFIKEAIEVVGQRTFTAGVDKEENGPKGGGGDPMKASTISKEVQFTTVVRANIL